MDHSGPKATSEGNLNVRQYISLFGATLLTRWRPYPSVFGVISAPRHPLALCVPISFRPKPKSNSAAVTREEEEV